jgi:hypothetical protein
MSAPNSIRHRRFGRPGDGRTVAVAGTVIVWTGLEGWLDALADLSGRARPSAVHFARSSALHRSLSPRDLRDCRDPHVLQRAAGVFDALRRGWSRSPLMPSGRDRAHWAALLVEARNQIDRIARGRPDGPRAKGPRFDPRRLPTDRLLALLQSTPDAGRRAALDAERRRRADADSYRIA